MKKVHRQLSQLEKKLKYELMNSMQHWCLKPFFCTGENMIQWNKSGKSYFVFFSHLSDSQNEDFHLKKFFLFHNYFFKV